MNGMHHMANSTHIELKHLHVYLSRLLQMTYSTKIKSKERSVPYIALYPIELCDKS